MESKKSWKNADLREANLEGANLRGADLRRADLKGADLREASLEEANLRGADLGWANLREANLRGANLRGANLEGTNLRGADLREANLEGGNLRGAELKGADLREANLEGANLREADLRGTSLENVIISMNTIGYNLACPEEGSFVAYKKAGENIVKLLVLEDAKRSSATTSKCRCSAAKVLDIENIKTGLKEVEACSDYDPGFIYRVGEIVHVDNFDDDRWKECAPGIHFFVNKENAINY